jgi:hypothetical protein
MVMAEMDGNQSRKIVKGQIPQGPSHDQPKEIPVEVTVGKIMEKLKPELNLDALQVPSQMY